MAQIAPRGETLGMIAALATHLRREVRANLKAAGTHAGAPAGAAPATAPVLVAEGGEESVSARSETRRVERQTCGGDDTLGG